MHLNLGNTSKNITKERFEDQIEKVNESYTEEQKQEDLVRARICKKLIDDHKPLADHMRTLYHRYKSDKPILYRSFTKLNSSNVEVISEKINNKLVSGFEKEVVDVKVSYGCGIPIIYDLNKDLENYDTLYKLLKSNLKTNNIEDLDVENWKKADICGVSYELWYIGEENEKPVEKVISLDPWEVIPINDRNTGDMVAAIRYYESYLEGSDEKTMFAEYYDNENVYYYYRDATGEFVPEEQENGKKSQPHRFPIVPIVKCQNNSEEIGGFEVAISYIDAYDRCVSDFSSEMEQTRLAYLIAYGAQFDDDLFQELKQMGIIELDNDGKLEWLTKNIDVTAIQALMEKLEKLIIRFCGSVDFTDANLYGNLTKMAISYKLRLLESKTRTFERKYNSALRRRWKLISGYWALKNISLDPMNDIDFVFTRNVPINSVEEAETLNKHVSGGLSYNTAFSQLSFVRDPEQEIEKKIEEENRLLEETGGVNFFSEENVSPENTERETVTDGNEDN